jgi:hypothetical protein
MKTGMFHKGQSYRVRKDFVNGSEFFSGEVLIFNQEAYSRYDSAEVFEFLDSAGRIKLWLLSDSDSFDWRDFFEPI